MKFHEFYAWNDKDYKRKILTALTAILRGQKYVLEDYKKRQAESIPQ